MFVKTNKDYSPLQLHNITPRLSGICAKRKSMNVVKKVPTRQTSTDSKHLLDKIKLLESQLTQQKQINQIKEARICQLENLVKEKDQHIKQLQKSRNSARHLTLQNDFYEALSSQATLKSIGKSSKNEAYNQDKTTKFEELNFSVPSNIQTEQMKTEQLNNTQMLNLKSPLSETQSSILLNVSRSSSHSTLLKKQKNKISTNLSKYNTQSLLTKKRKSVISTKELKKPDFKPLDFKNFSVEGSNSLNSTLKFKTPVKSPVKQKTKSQIVHQPKIIKQQPSVATTTFQPILNKVLHQTKRKTPVVKKKPVATKSFQPIRTERAMLSQRSSNENQYSSRNHPNINQQSSTHLNSKYLKEQASDEPKPAPLTINTNMQDMDMNIQINAATSSQCTNLLDLDSLSPYDLRFDNRDLDSNYNTLPKEEEIQPLEKVPEPQPQMKTDFDVIYERNSENSQTHTHSMSIRTLNSPQKNSPIKIDNFGFKGRIFEINEEIIKENESSIGQQAVDECMTPRIEAGLFKESQTNQTPDKKPSADTPEQISIQSFYQSDREKNPLNSAQPSDFNQQHLATVQEFTEKKNDYSQNSNKQGFNKFFQMHNDSLFNKYGGTISDGNALNSYRGPAGGSQGTPQSFHVLPHQVSQVSVCNLPKPAQFCTQKHLFASKNSWTLPGICYKLIGDYLNEKLPLIIFTNKASFKMSLSYQIEEYEMCRQQALHQILYIESQPDNEELKTEITYIKEIADAYESIKNNVIDFKNIVQ